MGPRTTVLLDFNPSTLLAQGTAISLLAANVANVIIGLVVAGWISDRLTGPHDSKVVSQRCVLLGLSLVYIWARRRYCTSVRTGRADDELLRAVSSSAHPALERA